MIEFVVRVGPLEAWAAELWTPEGTTYYEMSVACTQLT